MLSAVAATDLSHPVFAVPDNRCRLLAYLHCRAIGEPVFKDNGITTIGIESLSPEEKKLRLAEADQRLRQALTESNNTLLGQRVPKFQELLSLSQKGFKICCRYMSAVEISSISFDMSGLQIDIEL